MKDSLGGFMAKTYKNTQAWQEMGLGYEEAKLVRAFKVSIADWFMLVYSMYSGRV